MAIRIIEGPEALRALVGQEVGVSDWLEVTQVMIDSFAEITRDPQWIHQDVERARRESPFGTTIAHGFLTLSLVSHLHSQSVRIAGNYQMAINYGLNRVRFTSPVPSGSRIRTHSKVAAVDDIPGGVQVAWHIVVERENSDKPALVAEWIGRLYG